MEGAASNPRLPDREAEALAEIGATRISRTAALASVAVFLLVLLAGPACELLPLAGGRVSPRIHGPVRPISWGEIRYSWRVSRWRGVEYRIKLLLGALRNRAERDGAFSRVVRPAVQSVLLRAFRYGNGQVLVAEDGWMFYQRPVSQVLAPPMLAPETLERRARPGWKPYPATHPDPVTGLVRLRNDLAARGARLAFVPIPEKEQVYPERLRDAAWTAAPVNPDYDLFVARLEAAGIPVFDAPRQLFREARHRRDLWALRDAHWTPAGLDLTAARLAGFLRDRFGPLPGQPVRFGERLARVRLRGDLANLLGFALGDGPRAGLEFETTAILGPHGRPYLAAREPAPILLLGDSFSLVFQTCDGSPCGAGFAEHLARHAQRRVGQVASHLETELDDRIALLARHPEKLRAARIVLYQVATRGLGTYNWKPAHLPAPGAGPTRPARRRSRR